MFSMTVFATENKNGKNDNIFAEDKTNIMISADHPQFTIKLKSNPTTGFSWFLREYDANLIAPVKHSYQQQDANVKLMGAPGYELWTFKVKPSGFVVPQHTAIRFVYMRPWSSSDSSSQVVFRVNTQSK